MYIVHEDEQGRLFADALLEKAAREDGGRRRPLGARRLDQPEPRELDGKPRAGRGVENERFARQMQEMFLDDLENATEVFEESSSKGRLRCGRPSALSATGQS